MGYDNDDISDIFDIDYDFTKDINSIGEKAPDIKAIQKMRTNQAKQCFLGKNVEEICRKADIVFMALHGDVGENGQLQATFDILGIKYTGSGYIGSGLAMDKSLAKKMFIADNIPTPFGKLFTLKDDVSQWEKFPCVVKPVDGNSSKGVHRADSVEEAKQYVQEDINMSRAKTAIIEDFCPGDEIQVDCVALEEDAEVVMTRSKVKDDLGEGSVLNSVGSIVPAQIPEKLIPELKVIAKNIAKGFGLRNTPFFYQAIVTGDKVSVLEFAPRVGGGLSFYMIKNFVGFDAVEAAMVSYMGLPINFEHHPISGLYRTGHLYSKPCTFDHIEGIEELKQEGIIHEYFTAKSKGDEIDGDMRSGNRVASYIVKATTLDELNRRIALCKSRIIVIDEGGNNVIL